MMGYLYFVKDDLYESERYLLESFQKNYQLSIGLLVDLYYRLNNVKQAEKFAEIGLQKKFLPIAGLNIAFTYYKQNIKKGMALSIVRELVQESSNIGLALLPVLKVWNGVFEDLDHDLYAAILTNSKSISYTLHELLVHYQIGLVLQLFQHEEFGTQLSENYYIVHSAAEILLDESVEIWKKAPPELRKTIHEYVLSIYQKRDFYYSTGEAERYLQKMGPGLSDLAG